MEKCQFADLPEELIIHVLSYIHGKRHLARIALVSKRFKNVVEVLLYRHISLAVNPSASEFRNTKNVNKCATTPSFSPFYLLINNLCVHQGLGKHVRTLTLQVYRYPWAAHSRLLERLPEIRALSLDPPPLHLNIPYNDWALKSLRLNFSHVIEHYDERDDWLRIGVPLEIIARHLRLPKLRTVHIEKAFFTELFDETRHLPIGSSNVNDLRFFKCYETRSNRVVASFLRSIKYLKCFVFEFISDCNYFNGPISPKLYDDVFEIALTEHQETIEELAIAASLGAPRVDWLLGSLTKWTSLKRLAVPICMISGELYEILPPLLESFQIEHSTGYHKRTLPPMAHQPSTFSTSSWLRTYENMTDAAGDKNISDVRRVAENKDSYVPRLNRVTWWYQIPTISAYPNPTTGELIGLIGVLLAFKQVGVRFEWVIEPRFEHTPFGKRLCEWQE